MESSSDDKKHLSTLVSCCNMLDKKGFSTQFKALPEGLQSLTTQTIYLPMEVKVINFYRFEGESNPSDNSILYAIETCKGERGTLTDAYGPYSDSHITAFMKHVDEIHKKVNKDEIL